MMKSKVVVTVVASIAAAAQGQTVYIGNTLVVPGPGRIADQIPPLVILGEYNPAGPLATSSVNDTLPTGTVQDVQFYGDAYGFTLYALSLVDSNPSLNEQTFDVVASETFSGSAPTGFQTLPVSGFSVTAGDLLAFAGIGPYYQPPYDTPNSDATYGNAADPSSYAATAPGGPGTQFTVGLNGDPNLNPNTDYDYIPNLQGTGNQGRTYIIGVDVEAVPEPSTLLMVALGMAVLAAMRSRQTVDFVSRRPRRGFRGFLISDH